MITTKEILIEAKKVKTLLASLSTEEKNNALLKMADALIENADEPYADKIANAICRWRNQKRPIETTTDLRKCITEALSFLPFLTIFFNTISNAFLSALCCISFIFCLLSENKYFKNLSFKK